MSNNRGSISGSLKNGFGNVLGTALGVITVGIILSLYNSKTKEKANKPVSPGIGAS